MQISPRIAKNRLPTTIAAAHPPSIDGELISLGGLAGIVLGIVADEMWAQRLLSIASWSLGAM